MTWYNQNMDDLAADEAKLIDECLKKAYNKTIISLTFGCLNALISLLIIFLFIDAATHCSISVISDKNTVGFFDMNTKITVEKQ